MAPAPSEGAKLTRARIGAVLKKHRIRRLAAEEVRTVLRGDVLSLRSVYIESHVARALVLVARLKLAQAQIVKLEKQIETALAERVKSEEQTERRDLTILLSLPGFGPLTVAKALGESGDAFERRDYNALRSPSGAAPVSAQPGLGPPSKAGGRDTSSCARSVSRVCALPCISRRCRRFASIPSSGICTFAAERADKPWVAPSGTSPIDCSSWLSTSSVGTSSTTSNSDRSRRRQEEGPVEAVGAAAVGGVQGTCGKPRPFAVFHQARQLP